MPKYNEPLLPAVARPVERTIPPLTPAEPALGVCRRMLPLLVAELAPLRTISTPPLAAKLVVPADNTSCPPAPLFPLPTVMYTLPPRPDDAVPVPTKIVPLFPLAVPVPMYTLPVVPERDDPVPRYTPPLERTKKDKIGR